MISKFFALLLLISVSYTAAVFVVPKSSDALAKNIGTLAINVRLRAYKSAFEKVQTPSELQNALTGSSIFWRLSTLLSVTSSGDLALTGSINTFSGTKDTLVGIQKSIQTTRDQYLSLQKTIAEKRRQWQAVIDDVQRLAQTARELQAQLSELTLFSWSLQGSGSVSK